MSSATLSNLLEQMNQDGEVLNGWDAVLNLLESSVNEFFQSQWDSHSTSNKMTISQIWCEGVEHLGPQKFTNVVQINIDLGPPLFQFQNGQNSVTVQQDILSGSLKKGVMTVDGSFQPSSCGCQPNDPNVTWNETHTIDPSANPSLSGPVSLESVQGLVDNADSLILDFSKGAFVLNNISIRGVSNSDIVDQLKNWFATHEIKYILASVNFQNQSGLAGLTPKSFRFHVQTTNAGNTLVQLLITTDGSQPQDTSIKVDEPIPTADGMTCSLMVSSRILYNDILVNGFNQHGASFQLYAQAPSGSAAWTAGISPQMHFQGSFSFGSCCDRTTVTYSIYLGGTYSGSTTEGFWLYQHITPSGNVNIEITVNAYYPVTLTGSGASQQLNIQPGTPSVTTSGSCENEIKSQLENILNSDLRGAMAGISFNPVTYFALRNLVFPSNLIRMSQAQVPSDLLIVGTFEST